MELVESYLVEVAQYLPREQRRDIVRELREAIEEQVLDRAEAASRKAERDDELYVLAQFGHPMKVASGYREQRYLIGPAIFPTYIRTLKVVAVIAFVAYCLVGLGAGLASDWIVSVGGILSGAIELLFWALGITTLIFITIEYSGERFNWYDDWRPTSLSPDTSSVVDRTDVGTNLVSEGVFLLWWNDILVLQNWLPLEDGYPMSLSAVWDGFFWPLNILFALAFVLHAYTLTRGVWHRYGLILDTAIDVALLASIVVLLTAGNLVDVMLPNAFVANAIENVARMILVVVAGFTAWDIWVALRQLRGMLATA